MYITATAIILVKFFSILRQPGEVLDFYDELIRPVISYSSILHKFLSCEKCQSFWLACYLCRNDFDFMIPVITFVSYDLINVIYDRLGK